MHFYREDTWTNFLTPFEPSEAPDPLKSSSGWYWGRDAGHFVVRSPYLKEPKEICYLDLRWLRSRLRKAHIKDKKAFHAAFDKYYAGLLDYAQENPSYCIVPIAGDYFGKRINQVRNKSWLQERHDMATLSRNEPELDEVFLVALRTKLGIPRKEEVYRVRGHRTYF